MESSGTRSPDSLGDRLLRQIAAGDRGAFGQLYDRYATPLYSLALRMLKNEAEAQDVLQEVFLNIWNKAARYEAPSGHAFAWIATQVRHQAIDKIRARQRHAELLETNGPDLEWGETAVASSSELVETRERGQQVRQALRQISGEQQQVLALAYYEGLTQSEIAEKLEEPLGTIKARTQRGLARLREILRGLRA